MASSAQTFYAPKGLLAAWFAKARPGEATVYARGPALDPGVDAAAMVRDWLASRDVETFKGRDPRNGDLLHHVRRLCPVDLADERADERAGPVVPSRSGLDPQSRRLLDALTALADAGTPCPSFTELAELTDLPNRRAAQYRLSLLRGRGLVSIDLAGGVRTIRILEKIL